MRNALKVFLLQSTLLASGFLSKITGSRINAQEPLVVGIVEPPNYSPNWLITVGIPIFFLIGLVVFAIILITRKVVQKKSQTENTSNITSEQEPNSSLPVEKPKDKSPFIFIAIIALLLLIVPGSVMYYILTREKEETTLDRKEMELQREDEDFLEMKNDIVAEEVDNINFYTEELQKIMNNCILEREKSVSVEEKNLLDDASQYKGLLWINENVELIKNYTVIDLEVERDYAGLLNVKKDIEQCIDKISSFLLSENFVENNSNSFNNSVEGKLTNQNFAFEKGNLKLNLRNLGWKLSASFGDIKTANTPKVFQEIYLTMVPEKDFSLNIDLHSLHDDYALVTIFGGITAWDTILEKKPSDGWKQAITLYQYLPPCEEFVEANIPPELFDNAPEKFNEEYYKECRDENDISWHYNEYIRQR